MSNLTDAIRILNENPPPSHAIGELNHQIATLEKQLGIRLSPPTLNVPRATNRVARLRNELAQRGTPAPVPAVTSTPTPAPSTPAWQPTPAPAKPAPVAMGLPELASLHAMIFGADRTAELVEHRMNFQHMRAEWEAACADVEANLSKYGPQSPACFQAESRRARVRQRMDSTRGGGDGDKVRRLAADFFRESISLPGVSYREMGFEIPQHGLNGTMTQRQRQDAETAIQRFMAAIGGDLGALGRNDFVGRAARAHLAAVNPSRVNAFGALTV